MKTVKRKQTTPRSNSTQLPQRKLSLVKFSKFHMLIVAGIMAVLGSAAILNSSAYRSIGEGFGTFYAACGYSHRSQDDPIVFPGQPNAAHSHDFFGAKTLNFASTPDTIRQGATACTRFTGNATKNNADKSAYWVPTLYVDDQPVQATTLSAFYKSDYREVNKIEPFPAGLQVIAGSSAGGPQEINGVTIWLFRCHVTGTLVEGTGTTAPTCADVTQPGASLELHIRFPDCWDGHNLDSLNHKSHMAYSSQKTAQEPVRKCPPSHPHLMPALTTIINYPTNGGPSLRLSSGGINTAHADFMNGWDPAILSGLVTDCLRIDNYCGGTDKPVPGHAGNEPDPAPVGASGSTDVSKSASSNSANSASSGQTGVSSGSSGAVSSRGGGTASGEGSSTASQTEGAATVGTGVSGGLKNVANTIKNEPHSFVKILLPIALISALLALLIYRITHRKPRW